LNGTIDRFLLKFGFIRKTPNFKNQPDGKPDGTAIPACPVCGFVPRNLVIHDEWRRIPGAKSEDKIAADRDATQWRQLDLFNPAAEAQISKAIEVPRKPSPVTPYKNRYKCLYGNKGCGENAVYCEPCNKMYEIFLWMLNDDR
jgi:hypothetical protein